ncbi:MAG TPA: carboxypeptidase-like regulatory domain-containing protein, partial [Gemmatimonadaceae bacterium]|nr:carboxypeptidase-like regulatory domain-containing protein [Gemmatimonadaceae bacterium]
MNFRRAACVLVALSSLAFARTARAQTADVIRGRVSNAADSAAIPNATVTVTTISGGVNRTAKTDRNGRYTITFPNG